MSTPADVVPTKRDYFLPDSVYDTLKWIVQILLPALATLYASLSALWGLPHVTEVVGTIAAFALFLGTLLHISTVSYQNSDARFDGHVVLTQSDEADDIADVKVNMPNVAQLENKGEVTLKVKNRL